MGMGSEDLDVLARAAELHDIGKVGIPEGVLDKAGPLDDLEREMIETHTLIGQRILGAAPAMAPVARLVRSSHERWDGAGYPEGLAGDEIPLGSRIIFVCKAYQAMTTKRPYGELYEPEGALDELRRNAGWTVRRRRRRALLRPDRRPAGDRVADHALSGNPPARARVAVGWEPDEAGSPTRRRLARARVARHADARRRPVRVHAARRRARRLPEPASSSACARRARSRRRGT